MTILHNVVSKTHLRNLLSVLILVSLSTAHAATSPGATPQASPAATPADGDMVLIASRLTDRYAKGKFASASEYRASQNPDGSWKDVDYDDQSVGMWKPMSHLTRVEAMAFAYGNPASPDHNSVSMLQAVSNGLSYWFNRKPTSKNWWHRQIGQQLALEHILLLTRNALSPDLLETGASHLYDPVHSNSPAGENPIWTGQNLLWFCEEQLVRGLLRNNPQDVADAFGTIQKTIVISNGEGIQSDFSFHQHGAHLYNGGYGLGFLLGCADYASLTANTRFAFAPDKIDILSRYLLKGTRYMVRGKMLDYSVIGREVARPGCDQEARGLMNACKQMTLVDSERKADYDALKSHIEGTGEPYSITGDKYFWNSDYLTHQRNAYYASVKMNSSRTVGTETCNFENVKGYWLPFGFNLIAQKGDEFLGIFPVWDWKHLPGVTCPQALYAIPWLLHQDSAQVGGVSDGVYGAAAMNLDLTKSTSLHARKAWFFFDDEFVALGTGISSSEGEPVHTTLNQTLLKGEVTVDGQTVHSGHHDLKEVSWVLQNGVGYLFPQKTNLTLNNGPQNGDWKWINEEQPSKPVTKDVFSLWIDHGVAPADASYQYIVVPGTEAEGLAKYAKAPRVRILANTSGAQAVRHDLLAISQMVFYEPGQVAVRQGLTVRVDQPCLILLKEGSDGSAQLTVGGLGETGQVKVSMDASGIMNSATFDLPTGMESGSSQTKTVKLN